MRRNSMKNVFAVVAAVALITVTLLALSSCVPSYPREKLPEAVKSICKIEYDMDVETTVEGSTMGIYYPMKGLLDLGLGISEEAWDKISNLLLIASRVVLSTDADIRFYCVVAQDPRLPELQMVIIKYVDDIKRGMVRNISRGESFKRTLFSLNLTPQAEKERSIESVFDKLGVNEETKQKVVDEFFRSPPTKLSDIGYWKGSFYIKDITMEEFIAAQIANRVKVGFRDDEKLKKQFDYKEAEGFVSSSNGGNTFVIQFKIADQQEPGEAVDLNAEKVQALVSIVNEVVRGYKFRNFDFLMLEDQLEKVSLKISGDDVYNFDEGKMAVEDIAQAPAGYFVK